jgi:hypothetical protein
MTLGLQVKSPNILKIVGDIKLRPEPAHKSLVKNARAIFGWSESKARGVRYTRRLLHP